MFAIYCESTRMFAANGGKLVFNAKQARTFSLAERAEKARKANKMLNDDFMPFKVVDIRTIDDSRV